MTSARRFLVLQALLLWQGGFLFYAAFVVPVGTDVLGSPAGQGAITTRVTEALNIIGVVALAVLAWDLAATRDPSRRRTAARWWCWAVAALCQFLLFLLHQLLDSFMDPGRRYVVIRPPFRPLHGAYLSVCTVQWVAGLGLAWWTLRGWAAEDRGNIPLARGASKGQDHPHVPVTNTPPGKASS